MFKHSDKIILSADIGGSHITVGLVVMETMKVLPESIQVYSINARLEQPALLLDGFLPAFKAALRTLDHNTLAGIAIAMPGPFDYPRGVFRLNGLDKFGSLYGIDFRQFLYDRLDIAADLPVYFKNDADCFGLGVNELHQPAQKKRLIGITLGTGLGSAFIEDGKIIESRDDVPPGGHLYNQPLTFVTESYVKETGARCKSHTLQYAIAEQLISSRGILGFVNNGQTGDGDLRLLNDVATVADLARTAKNNIGGKETAADGEPLEASLQIAGKCREAFRVMGQGLGICLKPWYERFVPQTIVLGGGIAGAADLFLPAMRSALAAGADIDVIVLTAEQMEIAPLVGAACAFKEEYTAWAADANDLPEDDLLDYEWRKTHQSLLPKKTDSIIAEHDRSKGYNIFPYSSLGAGRIHAGYDSLARQILSTGDIRDKVVALDGYTAVDWQSLKKGLTDAFRLMDIAPLWIDIQAFAKSSDEIETLVAPFLGEKSSVWGRKTDLRLMDLFDKEPMDRLLSEKRLRAVCADLIIVYGTGAALPDLDAPVIFVELPKNEIQYRMRAGKADNLLTGKRPGFTEMYKRAYFVDWPILDQYRAAITEKIAIVADGQWRSDIHWMLFGDLYTGFDKLSKEPVRVRPWFAPGAWGGSWMKDHFGQLSKNEVNYAWSFELIVPENGLVFESEGLLMEVPFDWLMACRAENVLGEDAAVFGHYFPIRFDFLDTYNGGNLSIQCHPSLAYIREQFGESITQDETYYILDATPDAGVYLGFREGIDPLAFKNALEHSQRENQPVDILQFVQLLPARKHDLFLIPNQTVHSAGVNNLVLEISATPYIFTFKMYDWVRPDLNGRPRPINIEHAFRNLNFERSGNKVKEELCSRPVILESGKDMTRVNLPTHPDHFYAIHRLEIRSATREWTDGKCHIMMVVEGPGILLETDDGKLYYYAYAETFVVPAAVGSYRLIHPPEEVPQPEQAPVKVIKAFIK